MYDGVVAEFPGQAHVSPRTGGHGVSHQRQPASHQISPFFADKQSPLILGHRGVPLLHQENTIAGFRRALELGIDGVEFNVFMTRDGKIVVFHDEETERLTGVKGRITEVTWDEVSRLRIHKLDMGGGKLVTYPTEGRIPLLEEVLGVQGQAADEHRDEGFRPELESPSHRYRGGPHHSAS